MNPLISVIILVYNFEKWVEETVKSVLSQEGNFNFEIIIVNDSSTDNSLSVLLTFNDKRIQLINHDNNKGANYSFNEAFSKTKGKYIARLDGDDKYYHNFFLNTIPLLETNTDVGFVFGNFTTIDSDGNILNSHQKPARPPGPNLRNEFKYILENYYINAPTIIARREAWLKVYPIPSDTIIGDWVISLNMSLYYNALYLDKLLGFYRIHKNNFHNSMILNKTGEMATILILINFSKMGLEKNILTENELKTIYFKNYLSLGDKYFGSAMYEDARRCYLEALKNNPQILINVNFLKHLSGSFFPGLYNFLKSPGKKG